MVASLFPYKRRQEIIPVYNYTFQRPMITYGHTCTLHTILGLYIFILQRPLTTYECTCVHDMYVHNAAHVNTIATYSTGYVQIPTLCLSIYTPMTARLQRGTTPASCITSTGIPAKNVATIPKLLQTSHSTHFTHGATSF